MTMCVQHLGSIHIFLLYSKRGDGKIFCSYLTDCRMDIAAEMMLNTTEKSYTIAEKVGYLDANYFSYVFKRDLGCHALKYPRNEHLKK